MKSENKRPKAENGKQNLTEGNRGNGGRKRQPRMNTNEHEKGFNAEAQSGRRDEDQNIFTKGNEVNEGLKNREITD
jgi:hypothetical protein